MALDEPGEYDLVVKVDGFDFVIDKKLFALIKPVIVDCSMIGFHITGRIHAGDISTACKRH